MQSIAAIGHDTHICALMLEGRLERARYGPDTDYLLEMQEGLNTEAIQLQEAQNALSNTIFDYTPENKYVINP